MPEEYVKEKFIEKITRMLNLRYTRDGLPKVSEDTITVGVTDYLRYCSENIYNEIKNILKSENPLMLKLLEIYRETSPDDYSKEGFTFGFAECYKLLKRQAEHNKLEESIDL